MREHIAADEPFTREDVPVAQALERFREEGQDYKVELIEDLVRDADPAHPLETVSLYTNGPFTDLCRGPHAPSTKRIGAFKLQSVAGAYWRGDAKRQMLTRVYGTAFFKQAELDAFLEQLEQARARDHRKLGRELGLFTFSPLSPGSTFWLPKGTAVFNALVALNRRMQQERGYVEVKTPLLYESHLWETSGHWGKYKDNIFVSEYEEPRVRAEADELPGPLRPVRHAAVVLSRPPGALRRARAAAPPRAQRHAARPHARASLHPGRRPHLLHRGPDPGRGRADAGLRLRDLRHVRLPGARRALDASRRSSGRRCAVGPRRGGARQGARDTTASSTRSARARASSTARRSTCT